MNARFYFSTCQIGAEKAVKAEVAAEHPRLRFAFSRPGFVTFKDPDGGAPLELRLGIFTRLWGEVLDRFSDPATLADALTRIPSGAPLQCFDRDRFTPGEEPPGFRRDGNVRGFLGDGASLLADRAPNLGEIVYSLIWVDDALVFLTRHAHSVRLCGLPGNIVDLPLPDESPSRAYLKLEEALFRFKPACENGLTVLEVGCAPGGATTAMLNRGFRVAGVDPQFMDARVLARPEFRSIRKAARYLSADDIRSVNPDWLVVDMGIPPAEALAELTHVLGLLRSVHGVALKLRLGLITLKLNDWKLAAAIPAYLAKLEKLGFRDLRPTQLCANRQEIFVWAPRFALN
jgi:23S rRNA (cytidine2498-2'-O)-methyltransferase